MVNRQTMTIAAVTLTILPATDSAVDAWPSFLARGAFDTELPLATTAQT